MAETIWLVRFGQYVVGCWDNEAEAHSQVQRLSWKGAAAYCNPFPLNAECPVEFEVKAAIPARPTPPTERPAPSDGAPSREGDAVTRAPKTVCGKCCGTGRGFTGLEVLVCSGCHGTGKRGSDHGE